MDLSACISWGIANNQADVNIRNLSIHGISFLSKRNFTEGAKFQLIMSHHKKESGINKIEAEVVRCETKKGYSSGGRFQIGARFLFPANRPSVSEKESSNKNPLALELSNSQNPVLEPYRGQLKTPAASLRSIETLPVSSANRVQVQEVQAKFIQFRRTPTTEETIYTSIQIQQARVVSSPSISSPKLALSGKPLARIDNEPISTNLYHRIFPEKQLP